ncbi:MULTISPECIES: 3'(2'),5'-bisphosphate nucleotidase CysQ [Alteromonadaceae]|uniref:3'(2'),5'-bisphosphate nucleotidase CysQ n=1 Tax=Alteromonadaceae TaxID=72275 RepID=UPI001C08C698|nr:MULTISPECIES: 3'(2'),5'-bisphosphate nucleotidase CysQ [Aliiglaciecola]MBU2877519.1 3'(2'),5'-bisphosphate nucleotidase CysQ [Aliiglaciecola lipolytica]MDO6711099.1 3'(2'),5'-bisphosphate nucleotidase CysQ [Aliiglaciecola sp. 2_MG-2023]MDO6752013.1 3'(2'),5'-bisphosphate nucleotidase CysQ [Aliiglaciecola sp. 1_MG-2023]
MAVDPRKNLLEIAKFAAKTAGEEVLKIYDSGDFKAYEKEDESPVTSADYKANEIIMDILLKETPDIPIMSEETNNGDLAQRKHWQRYWLIDPIDGTQEFIARSGDFAVNIALIEDNEPVLGVIYWPAGETLYFASKGHGAYKSCSLENNKQIHVRKFEEPKTDVVMIAISRRQPRERIMNHMSDMRSYQTLPLGSCSLKACFIAEGKADVFLRIGVTGEWDTGASQCIVEEAGGCILSANFLPLTYNRRDTTDNPDFVVLGDHQVNWQEIVEYK